MTAEDAENECTIRMRPLVQLHSISGVDSKLGYRIRRKYARWNSV